MKLFWKVVIALIVVVGVVVAIDRVIKAIQGESAAKQRAETAEKTARMLDSIYQASKDSLEKVSQARDDSVTRLEASASSSRKLAAALSRVIDSLVATDSGGVAHLPPDATALDSAKTQAAFWLARYTERTEAQRLAMREADSLRAANLILHREVLDGRRLMAQADSTIRAWKESSERWKAVADCRIPLIRIGCPSRTVMGITGLVGGIALGR